MKSFVLSVLLSAAVMHATTLTAQEFNLFKLGSKVIRHSTAELSSPQRGHFREMSRDAGYFSAMAIIPNSEFSAWTYFHHELGVAQAFAMEECRIVAPEFGLNSKNCILYASVVPKSAPSGARNLSGLSEVGLTLFYKYAHANKEGNYGAFAINRLTDAGAAPNASDPKKASSMALQACKNAFEKGSADWRPELLRWVLRNGLNKCKVVTRIVP